MSILKSKLATNYKREILSELLDYSVDNDGVIYDDEGMEFYGNESNSKYDFDTLSDVIRYLVERAEQRGRDDKVQEIREVLGL